MKHQSRKELIRVANEWMSFWRGRDLSSFDKLHTSDFIDHCPSGREKNRESFKQGLVELYRAFPDFRAKVDGYIIDQEASQIAIRWTAMGIHQKSFMGIQPTEKQISFRGIEIIKIVDGCVTQRWGEWDGLDLLHQLQS